MEEVRLKMDETAELLDQLLPLVNRLLATPEPKTPGANTYWWMERERINRWDQQGRSRIFRWFIDKLSLREFEQILKRFMAMHEFLSRGKMTVGFYRMFFYWKKKRKWISFSRRFLSKRWKRCYLMKWSKTLPTKIAIRRTLVVCEDVPAITALHFRLSKKIREICQRQLCETNGQNAPLSRNPVCLHFFLLLIFVTPFWLQGISIVVDERVSPTRSRSMEPEEFRKNLGTMKRSSTRSSVRSVSSGRVRNVRLLSFHSNPDQVFFRGDMTDEEAPVLYHRLKRKAEIQAQRVQQSNAWMIPKIMSPELVFADSFLYLQL